MFVDILWAKKVKSISMYNLNIYFKTRSFQRIAAEADDRAGRTAIWQMITRCRNGDLIYLIHSPHLFD